MSRLKFKNGVVEDYTLVLCTRNYKRLGQIGVMQSLNNSNNLNSADEIGFTISKYQLTRTYDNLPINKDMQEELVNNLWENIIDFRLVWVKELDKYFSIRVTINDGIDTQKTITGISLCEEELSQIYNYSMEINTENDIARDEYDVNFPTVFYRDPVDVNKYTNIWQSDVVKYTVYQNDGVTIDTEATYQKRYTILKESSLLHRATDKLPHYSIGHVDASLQNLQRTFSVNGSTVYDFLTGECAEQFNCLFLFDSATRTIAAYDLYTVCMNCGYRDEEFDVCPECGSTNIKYYGEDTTILIDKNNLTDSIQLETNADEIKNCIKLIAGDELMTAVIRTLNPNGSDYLYYVSEFQRKDMSQELVQKLNNYDVLYNENINVYEKLIEQLWDLQGQVDTLEHTKMPTLENAEVTAQTEIAKLEQAYRNGDLNSVGVSSITTASKTTVDSSVKNYLKVFVQSGYVKIELTNTNYEKHYTSAGVVDYGSWSGTVTLTNYSDKDDVATYTLENIAITGDYQQFVEQKVLKSLAEDYSDKGSVFDVLALEDIDKFTEALTLYCKERLVSFRDAIDGALMVLAEMEQGNENAELYKALYEPYYAKLQACEQAIATIDENISKLESEIEIINKDISDIQDQLNFQNYLGDLYSEFCCYRREDTYENANYISDGLTDSELITKAKEFLEAAKQQLKRTGEPQYTINTTLYNLLIMKEFQPIVDYFELGNWIRIRVDDHLYRLRLIGYSVNFDDLQTINVSFSTVTKLNDAVTEMQSILKATTSMASNFDYVAQQAAQGDSAKNTLNDFVNNGLNSALNVIKSGTNETQKWDKHGILCRTWDDETESYGAKQLRIIHNNICYTTDGWKTVIMSIGEHEYSYYNPETNQWVTGLGYGQTAEYVNAGYINGSTVSGGIIISSNFSDGTHGREAAGSYINLDEGTFSFAAGNLIYDGKDLIISENSLTQSLEDVDLTLDKLHIRAENITGYIADAQISSISSTKIVGDISVSSQNITGLIESEQIKTIDVSQITGELIVESNNIAGLIKDAQIESIASSKITGAIYANEADSVKATNIDGIINTSQLSDTLSNKNITGKFSGQVEASSIKSMDTNGATYEGITGEYIIGEDTVLKIVNGIIVSVTQTTMDTVE